MAKSSARTTFRDRIAINKRQSAILVALFVSFTAAVVVVLTIIAMGLFDPNGFARVDWTEVGAIGVIAVVIISLIAWLGYWQGDRMVLGVSKARPIAPGEDPELFHVVEEMAIAAGVPMPRVYLIDDPAPNAFATGRDPAHSSIAVTTGLRTKLTRDELQGVVGHEMSHVRNLDTRLMLLMAVLIGSIAMLADVVWQMSRFSAFGGGRRGRDRDKSAGLISLVLIVVGVLLAVVAPILAQIIQFAVSRTREYLADASGVELTRYPQGLANALRKIAADPTPLASANRGTAHLYIANPIPKFEKRGATLFASHPPIEDRIRRLESLLV